MFLIFVNVLVAALLLLLLVLGVLLPLLIRDTGL